MEADLIKGVPFFVFFFLLGSIIVISFPRRTANILRPRVPTIVIASVGVADDGRILVDEDEMLPYQKVCLDGLPSVSAMRVPLNAPLLIIHHLPFAEHR